MQRILILTSRATIVFLAFVILRQTLVKSTFSAGLPNKEGGTCYIVKGDFPNNNVYQGSRILPSVEVHVVEAWDTLGFNDGKCDTDQKSATRQYKVKSEFNPTEQTLKFQVYRSGTLTSEEAWRISLDGKTNYRLSPYSKHELSLSRFSL